jgi:hypothetical protein
MVAITANSANSATAAISVSMAKTRVVETRRDAEQAQNIADGLRRQADDANRVAEVSQDNARSLAERSNQMVASYVQSQRGVSVEPRVLSGGVVPRSYAATPPSASLLLPAVVNTQGQATGQLVNVSA